MSKYKSLIAAVIVFAAILFIESPSGLSKYSDRVAGIWTFSEDSGIYGLVLPHHGLAEEMIIESFEKLKGENYSYIVIFGPNHFAVNAAPVVTADSVFGVPLESDSVEMFLERYPDVLVSNELISAEHSITLQLPYLSKYFPESKVIPLIISPYASYDDLGEKVNYLVSKLPDNTLYIASVDFSHNTMYVEALKKNEESIFAIEGFDYQTIYNFEDDHMDSPASIVMLLRSMQEHGSTTWETWESSHAAMIVDDATLQGTSYVIGVFR